MERSRIQICAGTRCSKKLADKGLTSDEAVRRLSPSTALANVDIGTMPCQLKCKSGPHFQLTREDGSTLELPKDRISKTEDKIRLLLYGGGE